MVRSITHNIGSTSHNSTQSYHIVARLSGVKVPFAGRQPATVGGMEDFSKALEGEGVSKLAATLITNPEGQSQYLITNLPSKSGLAGVVNWR